MWLLLLILGVLLIVWGISCLARTPRNAILGIILIILGIIALPGGVFLR